MAAIQPHGCRCRKLLRTLLAVWTLGAGCSAPAGLHFSPGDRDRTPALYIAGVPFYPQESDRGGPASLAAVLNYWGLHATPEQISKAIHRPPWKGTPEIDMWSYASARQMDARMRSASLDDLRHCLENRIPIIASVDLGSEWFPAPHFVVVVGLDTGDQVFVTHNGNEHNQMPYRDFMSAWQKTNNWTLVVRPKLES